MVRSSTNRWLVLLGAVITQLGLGTIYAWSLFNQPLADQFGFSVNSVAVTFSITSLSLALATLVAGKLQEKFGIRKLITVAGFIFGVGLLLTAFDSTIFSFYLTAGVIVGAADGVAYITTLSNSIKWFPDKKGLISGISVGAYGCGSLIFKYIDAALITRIGVSKTFLAWGIMGMILTVAGAQLLKDAPENGAVPAGTASSTKDLTVGQMLKTKEAYLLFVVFFTACMSGLYLIGIVKDIGVQLAGLSVGTAVNAVAMVAIFNTAGRIVLGALSDKIGRLRVVLITMVVTAASVFTLAFSDLHMVQFYCCVCAIAFCFGGNITVFPAITGEFFGIRNQTKNYGIIYQGFGFGPIVASAIASVTGGFTAAFAVVGLMCIVSIVIVLLLSRETEPKKAAKKLNYSAAA